MVKSEQMSETFSVGALLALFGGFVDAYTFISRGGVFANAQTGNMVLVGINLITGNMIKVLRYLVPITAYFLGIILAEIIKNWFKGNKNIHWRQMVVIIELLVVVLVAFLPSSFNILANTLISFVCSLQTQSFRKLNGVPYASTMCTGNLRYATEHLYMYNKYKDKSHLSKSIQYYCIILMFIIGATAGAMISGRFSKIAVLFGCIPLLIALAAMFISPDKQK